MTAIDRACVLVLGDSGVGKTSFVHLAANNEPIYSPSWTIGCSLEVKLHEYKEGTKEQKTYFIEFWDVGGSNNHRNARHVFYNPCHGVILVHDLTNRKSEQNLHKWLQEIIDCDNTSCYSSPNNSGSNSTNITIGDEYDSENFLGSTQAPILVIGTKLDQIDERKSAKTTTFAAHVGADEIFLDCRQARYLAAGTTNAVKLARFYDKVIENKYFNHNNSFTEKFENPISPKLPSKFYSPHQD